MASLAAASAAAASRALPGAAAEASPAGTSGTAAPQLPPPAPPTSTASERSVLEKLVAEIDKALETIRAIRLPDGSEPGTRFVAEREWDRPSRGVRRRARHGP